MRTCVAKLAEELEWFFKVASKVIRHGHKRGENRYIERVIERPYLSGSIVRVLLHARNRNVFSKV